MRKREYPTSLDRMLFRENEKNANHYTAVCLIFAAGICALVWILNLLDFFIIDDVLMNTAMPIGMALFLSAFSMEKMGKIKSNVLKYILVFSFLIGIALLSVAMPRHLILAWACPVVLSSHYYSPRFTRVVLIVSFFAMFASLYGGIYFGEWDSNIMDGSVIVNGFQARCDYIAEKRAAGSDIYLRSLEFYYIPRAAILSLVYLICRTLTERTQKLLIKQAEAVGETERISAELNVANHIQTSMLPSISPHFAEHEDVDIYAMMTPAKEVGGDFYDFFMVDDRHLATVVADVSGKGVPAALFMVIGKTLIKDHTKSDKSLGSVFDEVNQLLCEANSEGLFITAFEGVLDLDTGEFTYVNAGHELPYLSRRDGGFAPLSVRHGFVLAGMEHSRFAEGKITLEQGDKLFYYTDGVTEATDSMDRLYGREHLSEILGACVGKSPKEVLEAVKVDIDAFVGEAPQFDDITMLCFEYKKGVTKE